MQNKLYSYAKKCLGLTLAPTYRDLGCVESLQAVFKGATGLTLNDSPSTSKLYISLQKDKRFIPVTEPIQGDIIISPTGYGNGLVVNGHTGIISDSGKVMSNNSKTLKWSEHITLEYWKKRYGNVGGMPVKFFRYCEPVEATPEQETILRQIIAKLQEMIALILNKRK